MRQPDSRGWRKHADALAEWAARHLSNRDDAWGAYLPFERRKPGQPSVYTAPPLAQRGRIQLRHIDLVRHFCGECVEHIIGLHSTSEANTSWWGAFDIDVHEPVVAADAPRRIARLVAACRERGVEPMVEDACGRGGAHLWIVCSAPVPTPDVFALLQDVQRAAGVSAETFPKQPRLTSGMFGNWLRLPGRHHTRPHWSRIAAGGKWRRGRDAARAILEHPLTPAAVIPSAPPLPAPAMSWPSRNTALVPRDQATRVARYLDALPRGLRAGEQRSDVAFSFARFLVLDVACSDAEALDWLRAWNQRNATALPETKLVTTLANVHRYCRGAA